MIITDKILNQIIDNELDFGQRKEALNIIAESKELSNKLLALTEAHKQLQKIPTFNVSDNFNQKIIDKINKATKYAKSQKRFFIGVFTIISLLLTGVFVFLILAGMHSPANSTFLVKLDTNMIENISSKLSALFSGKILTIISSIISLIIYSVIYFLEEGKKLKKLRNG